MFSNNSQIPNNKNVLRHLAMQRRRAQRNKDQLSSVICNRAVTLEDFQLAERTLIYVDVRSEVRTRQLIQSALTSKDVYVPYCHNQDLRLFRLKSLGELARGHFGIAEPTDEARDDPDRKGEISNIDIAIVPGVAFSQSGIRLGHGKGYFDRLLAGAPPELLSIGLAFECQVFDNLPSGPHDISIDVVVTEENVYQKDRTQP